MGIQYINLIEMKYCCFEHRIRESLKIKINVKFKLKFLSIGICDKLFLYFITKKNRFEFSLMQDFN